MTVIVMVALAGTTPADSPLPPPAKKTIWSANKQSIIGPHDSGDSDVFEYHALLMRLAGIDGVVIDWHGTVDHLDDAVNHRNTAAVVQQAVTAGLEFADCDEDQTIPTPEQGLDRSRRPVPRLDRKAQAQKAVTRVRWKSPLAQHRRVY